MTSTIRVNRKEAYSIVPDRILEDVRMRPETRLVLSWLVSRPDGWQIRVWYVQKVLGLTSHRWTVARKELAHYGYLRQERLTSADGKFYWDIEVTDTPVGKFVTILKKFSHGDTVNDEEANKTILTKHQESNTPLNPPKVSYQLSSSCYEEGRKKFPGFDIYSLEHEWRKWSQKQLSAPINPDKAFLAWARKYVERNPLPYSARGGAK